MSMSGLPDMYTLSPRACGRVSGISGMEYWNGIMEWNAGMKHWSSDSKINTK